MTDQPAPSVCQLLADLHAYRQRTMAPADLQVNIDQRQLLEDTADRREGRGEIVAGAQHAGQVHDGPPPGRLSRDRLRHRFLRIVVLA